MGPSVHTLSHNKKAAVHYPALHHFKPSKGQRTLKKLGVMRANGYHFWIQHEKLVKKHIPL